LPQLLTQEDAAYHAAVNPYRKACGLMPLPQTEKYPVNFSGFWTLDEAASDFGRQGKGNAPYKMMVEQQDDQLFVTPIRVL
jgi:hypothetical protein